MLNLLPSPCLKRLSGAIKSQYFVTWATGEILPFIKWPFMMEGPREPTRYLPHVFRHTVELRFMQCSVHNWFSVLAEASDGKKGMGEDPNG